MLKLYIFFIFSGHVRPRQGTEICNFGAPSPLEALHWIFVFSPVSMCNLVRRAGESSEKSSGENRVKSCHVSGCHGFSALKNYNLAHPRIVLKIAPKLLKNHTKKYNMQLLFFCQQDSPGVGQIVIFE